MIGCVLTMAAVIIYNRKPDGGSWWMMHAYFATTKISSIVGGECPSNSPFFKNNGAEAPNGPRPIVFKEWRDMRTFSNLKSTHCTLLILLIINPF
jgi:hypothetical protein